MNQQGDRGPRYLRISLDYVIQRLTALKHRPKHPPESGGAPTRSCTLWRSDKAYA